jgi:hypothetical protein
MNIKDWQLRSKKKLNWQNGKKINLNMKSIGGLKLRKVTSNLNFGFVLVVLIAGKKSSNENATALKNTGEKNRKKRSKTKND